MKKMQVETVFDHDGFRLGFRARREVVFGINQDAYGWAATHSIRAPKWVEGFQTRKAAEEFLRRLRRERGL